jgi:hypothetical protein
LSCDARYSTPEIENTPLLAGFRTGTIAGADALEDYIKPAQIPKLKGNGYDEFPKSNINLAIAKALKDISLNIH